MQKDSEFAKYRVNGHLVHVDRADETGIVFHFIDRRKTDGVLGDSLKDNQGKLTGYYVTDDEGIFTLP